MFINPDVIPEFAKFATGGIGFGIVAALVLRMIYGSLTALAVELLDEIVPDTERRRRQMLILSGLRTIEREKRRKIRGEETEQL